MFFPLIRGKPIELHKYLPVIIAVWMIVLTLFPCYEYKYGMGRNLYRVVHYGLMPLFLGIVIFSSKLKLKEQPWLRLGWIDWAMICYLFFVIVSVLLNDDLMEGQISYIIAVYRRIFVAFVAYWLVRIYRPDEKALKSF